jgi:hypothetical protein
MKCEYRYICEHHRKDSWYCNQSGGSGCGTYRWHENERARIKEYMWKDILMLYIILVILITLNVWGLLFK